MRWAVVGANSFSGNAFADYIEHEGEETLRLSRPDFDLNSSSMSKLESFEPDYVVNFAALNMVAESWAYFADYYRTNVIGLSRLADALRGTRMKRFIQVSTPEVYGTTETFIKEDAPYNPSTPYAVSRAAADMHLKALYKATGFPVIFTRTVNVYGPRQQLYRIIPKTVLKIHRNEKLKLHGGGLSTRSFIHILDVARGIALVAGKGDVGEVYHMSTNTQTSIRNLVERICEQMKVKFSDVVEDDAERTGKDKAYQLCDEKIRSLGWEDRIDISAGLSATVYWFDARAERFAGRSLEYEHRG